MIKPRVRKPSVVSLRILPSAMTVAAICLGLSSVKFALDNRPTEAMAFLAVAAILDALDGRIARVLNATSRMGEEIDSLADAVNFGVAPAFIVYGTLLSQSRIGWIVVLLYSVCIVLRLPSTGPPTRSSISSVCPPRPARSARSARWRPRCSSARAGGHPNPRW